MNHVHDQRPAPPGRALSRAGFSMLEMVVVLAVIAVAAAVAVPRYARGQQRYRVIASGERLCADIERARSLAMASSAGVRVVFQSGSDTYDIIAMAPGGGGSTYTTLAQAPYRTWIADPKFDSGSSLNLSALGVPSGPGEVWVRAESLGAKVEVDSAGMCRVGEPESLEPARKPITDARGGR